MKPRQSLAVHAGALLLSVPLFVASVVALPRNEYSPSAVGRWIWRCEEKLGLAHEEFVDWGCGPLVMRTFIYSCSANDFVKTSDVPLDRIRCTFLYIEVPAAPSGWWAPAFEVWQGKIVCVCDDPGAIDMPAVRRAFIDELAAERFGEVPRHQATLYAGDAIVRTPIWRGWVHNAVSLIASAASIALLVKLPKRVLHVRRNRVHPCQRCGYPLGSIPTSFPCPECGTPR